MLSIRSAQQQGFKKAAEDLFSKEMLAHFKTFSPQQFARLGDKGASEVIRLGIEKAKKFGFTQRGPVKFFLELLFLFGLDFDQDKNMKWAMDLLKKGDVDQIERADQLYAALAKNQPKTLPALDTQLAAGGGAAAAAANGGAAAKAGSAAAAAAVSGATAGASAAPAAVNPVAQMEIEQFSVKVKTGEQLLEEYKAAHPGEPLPESPMLLNYATEIKTGASSDIKTGAVPGGSGAPNSGLDPSSAAAMGHLSVAPDAFNAQGQIDPQRAHEKALLRTTEVDPKVKQIVAPGAVAAANPAMQPSLSFAEKTAMASDQRIQTENKRLAEEQAGALDQARKSDALLKQEGAGGLQDQLGAQAKATAPNTGQNWQDAIGKAQAQAGQTSANAAAGGSTAAGKSFTAQGAQANAAASAQNGSAADAKAGQAGTTAGVQGGAAGGQAGTNTQAGVAGGQAGNAAEGASPSGGAAAGMQGGVAAGGGQAGASHTNVSGGQGGGAATGGPASGGVAKQGGAASGQAGAAAQTGVTGGQTGNSAAGAQVNSGSSTGNQGGGVASGQTGAQSAAATGAPSGSATGGQSGATVGAQAVAGNGAGATANAKTGAAQAGAGSASGQAAATPRAVSANGSGGGSSTANAAGGTAGGSNGSGAGPAAAAASASAAKKDWRANLKQQIEEKVKKEAKNQLKDAAEDMAIGMIAGQLGGGARQVTSPAHNPISDMVIEQYSVKVKSAEQVAAEYLAAHPGESLPDSPMLAGYRSEITTAAATAQAAEEMTEKGWVWTQYGWQYTNPDLPADHPMRKLVIETADGPAANPNNIPLGAVSDGKGGWEWTNPNNPQEKRIGLIDEDAGVRGGNVLDMKSMPGMKVQRPSQTDKASEATDQTAQECPTLCPKKVELQDNGAKYGYDDFTSKSTVYLSVEQSQSTSIMALIVPGDKYSCVEFKSDNEGHAVATPAKAASGSQVVTVDGKARGVANVNISCNGNGMKKFVAKCYPKKIKTVMVRLVHEKNYQSKDIADSAIEAYLQKVYNQAVCEFKVTRLPAQTVDFDSNKDGKIDVDSWMSKEMKRIVDACKDDSYDHNMFIVSKPSDGSYGFMMFNQRYGFVHADSNPVPEQAFAHELGHGGFGLTHTENDDKNVMYNYGGDKGSWRLRHAQWDLIHGAAASKSDASAKQTPLVDELTPIAQYIANEMNTNARSKDAQNMYGLNTYSAVECLDQYSKQPWFVKLIQSEWPNQCIDNSFNYPAAALLAWTINVRQGARWDHKTTIPKMFHPRDPGAQHWHRYSDAEHGDYLYYFDIWSNIHYGYVGKACGFSDSQLLDGAGLEQIGSDLVSFKSPKATGNDPGLRKYDHIADRITVQLGIDIFLKSPNGVTATQILQGILNADIPVGTSKKRFVGQ